MITSAMPTPLIVFPPLVMLPDWVVAAVESFVVAGIGGTPDDAPAARS
jgi:hypothetical protein